MEEQKVKIVPKFTKKQILAEKVNILYNLLTVKECEIAWFQSLTKDVKFIKADNAVIRAGELQLEVLSIKSQIDFFESEYAKCK